MLPRSQENIRVENIRTENNNLNISVLRRQAEKDGTLLFYFSYGSYFGGECEILIVRKDYEKCRLYALGYNDFDLYWDFVIPIEEIKQLEVVLNPAKKWLRNYHVQAEIDDGYGWELIFVGNGYTIKSNGYMANPRNYFKICNKTIKRISKFKQEYSDNNVFGKLMPINGYRQVSCYNVGTKRKVDQESNKSLVLKENKWKNL